ncbi:MAG: AsmA family protein [Caulobacteraceae bacterium]
MDTRTASENRQTDAPVPSWSRRHRGAVIAGSVLAALILAVVLFLLLFDWDWLRGPIGRYASARTGREVRNLKVHPWSWTPSAKVQGLRIGNPSWVASTGAGSGDLAYVRQFDVSVKLLPLFMGRVELPLVRLEQPKVDLIRDSQNRDNWTFGASKSSKPRPIAADPAVLHPRRQPVDEGRQAQPDPDRRGQRRRAGRRFGAAVSSCSARGTINREPFRLEATGGPLIHVEASKPYPFHLDVKAGATHVEANGSLPKPFNLGQVNAEVTSSGPNLADLYPLTGITLPATPAYRLTAHLDRDDAKFTLTGISGRVGDSDLEGSMTLDKPNDRRRVVADLRSRKLVFSDLLAVIGGGPKAPGRRRAPRPPRPRPPAGRLLPDAPLYKERLRSMDAQLRYRAAAVETGRWPLRRFSLDLTLQDAVLTLDPVDFEFPQGRLAGKVRIDGRKDPAVSDLDMRLTGLELQQFFPAKAGATPALEGLLQARAQLHGRGDTIHEAPRPPTGGWCWSRPTARCARPSPSCSASTWPTASICCCPRTRARPTCAARWLTST